jgi:hypothetical protein
MACVVCGRAFVPSGRRRFCSDACRRMAWRRRHAPAPPPLPTRSPRRTIVYECSACGARYLGQQRCDECNRFTRRIGPGGLCAHCDQPIALADLLPDQQPASTGRSRLT